MIKVVTIAIGVVTIALVSIVSILCLVCLWHSLYFQLWIRRRGYRRLGYFNGPWLTRLTLILVAFWWGIGEVVRLTYVNGTGRFFSDQSWQLNACKFYVISNLGFAEPGMFLLLAFLLSAALQEHEFGTLNRRWNWKTIGLVVFLCLPSLIWEVCVILIGPWVTDDGHRMKVAKYWCAASFVVNGNVTCTYPLLSSIFLGVFYIMLIAYIVYVGSHMLSLVINNGLRQRIYMLIFAIIILLPLRAMLLGLSVLPWPEKTRVKDMRVRCTKQQRRTHIQYQLTNNPGEHNKSASATCPPCRPFLRPHIAKRSPLPTRTHPPVSLSMDAAASEIGDWEVLDAAFASGDDGEVLVSGDGGAVLHDHFALVSHVGFSSEGSWSVAASDAEEEDAIPEVAGKRVGRGGGESLHFDVAGGCAGSEGHEFLEQLDRLDSISLGSLDLYVADSSVQLEAGGIDETRESSVLKTAVTSDASLSALEKQVEAKGSEIEQEKNAKLVRSELDSDQQVFHHGTGEDLDLHSTTIGDESKRQGTSNPEVQLEAEGVDAAIESSFLEAVVATDAQEKQDQEKSGAFACNELDGEVRGGSLPLVQSSGAGKGEKRGVVWWRLPFRLLQYCALNVKPVWSLSIAAALVGLVVLGRGMYRMRHKSRGIPQIKIAFDDKKTSQFADRAARLNEAFLMVKRVPVIRTSSGAVLPWSMVQERC